MTLFILAALIAAATLGLVVWVVATEGRVTAFDVGAHRIGHEFRPWHLAVIVVAVLLIPLGASRCAAKYGTEDVLGGYQQFINGALVSADMTPYTCEQDGDCVNTYDCNPYTVFDYNEKGEVTGSHTEYHDCPYTKGEYTYTVTAWVGFTYKDYTIASHIFAENPEPWRAGKGIPGDVPRGEPAEWVKYRQNIAAGHPDAITYVDRYDNFVLASPDTLLKQSSSRVDALLAREILPEHTTDFLSGDEQRRRFQADKLSTVGFSLKNHEEWQRALMQFNAALGIERQGDMHIVVVSDRVISSGDSESYANALKAYWQGPKLGKKALAKNAIIVVLGVNPTINVITWARAKTGMPIGNGSMLASIERELVSQPLEPDVILGTIGARVVNADGEKTLKFVHGQGILDQIVFRDFPFARACMTCKDEGEQDSTSFVYLKASISLPWWAAPLAGLLAALGAIACAAAIIASRQGAQA